MDLSIITEAVMRQSIINCFILFTTRGHTFHLSYILSFVSIIRLQPYWSNALENLSWTNRPQYMFKPNSYFAGVFRRTAELRVCNASQPHGSGQFVPNHMVSVSLSWSTGLLNGRVSPAYSGWVMW